MPGFHTGQAPGNKGHRYPADPPKVEEIVAVMRAAGDGPHGRRMRALIVILWRAGLRINEALEPTEGDLDEARGALLARRGKGGRRREVGMDGWAWEELQPWLELRRQLPDGPLLCVIAGSAGGRYGVYRQGLSVRTTARRSRFLLAGPDPAADPHRPPIAASR